MSIRNKSLLWVLAVLSPCWLQGTKARSGLLNYNNWRTRTIKPFLSYEKLSFTKAYFFSLPKQIILDFSGNGPWEALMESQKAALLKKMPIGLTACSVSCEAVLCELNFSFDTFELWVHHLKRIIHHLNRCNFHFLS